MFPSLVCTWLALFLPYFTDDDAKPEGDLGRMQGKWETDSFAGTPTTFTFKGSKLQVTSEGIEYAITVTLDEKAKPEKIIDLKIDESSTASAVGKTSPGIYKFTGDDKLVICFRAQGDRPEKYETVGFEQWNLELRRQGGEKKETVNTERGKKPVEPAAADKDAPLPDGWPAATKPDAIEVKSYPKYRSAVMRNEKAKLNEDERLFFPLFNHISTKNIAMTSPVVMTYETQVVEKVGEKGEISMEFLYKRPDQGETGPGVGRVVVEDHAPVTVVALGVQGAMDDKRLREGVSKLRSWLDEHKDEWVAAGPPRRLGYHGPMTPMSRQLNEVQIPIKPAAEAAK